MLVPILFYGHEFLDVRLLSKKTLHVKVNEKRPVRRPQTKWIDRIKKLCLNHLGLRYSKIQSVMADRKMWWLYLSCCPAFFIKKAGEEERTLAAGASITEQKL